MLTAIAVGVAGDLIGETFDELNNALGLRNKEGSRNFVRYLTTLQK
jgi:hypothetical protein